MHETTAESRWLGATLRRAQRRVVAGAIAMLAVVLLIPAPAGAVVGGTPDASNVYANVGLIVERIDGEWFGTCTGTLVREDVVLTAAHCVDVFSEEFPNPFPVEDLGVVFDPVPQPETSIQHGVDSVQVHPSWWDLPAGGWQLQAAWARPEDAALIWLTEPVAGIEPAPIVGIGGLDGLALTEETFTVVGYGITEFISGTVLSPMGEWLGIGRNLKHVSVITEHGAIADRYLKISASTCFGDSGGPLFHGDTVVAINTWTSSWRCSAPSYSYRLDTSLAQTFLDAWLD